MSRTAASSLPGVVYQRLRIRFGHAAWWPGQTAFEVCVGAILVLEHRLAQRGEGPGVVAQGPATVLPRATRPRARANRAPHSFGGQLQRQGPPVGGLRGLPGQRVRGAGGCHERR